MLLVLGIAALSVLAASPAASAPAGSSSSYYLVQPDPRLCPSPACGGYWVELVNHARTRCSDGELRSRCYVARAVDSQRRPLETSIPAGALTRATVEPWRFEGLGELGQLVVARAYRPVGRAISSGRYYRVVDNGIRCVKAPCFSLNASLLNRASSTTVSGIDLGAVPQSERQHVERALGSKAGALAQGRTVGMRDEGRVLRATRFFLASER